MTTVTKIWTRETGIAAKRNGSTRRPEIVAEKRIPYGCLGT